MDVKREAQPELSSQLSVNESSRADTFTNASSRVMVSICKKKWEAKFSNNKINSCKEKKEVKYRWWHNNFSLNRFPS